MATLCKFRMAVHTTGILDQGHSVSIMVLLVSIDHAVHQLITILTILKVLESAKFG